MANQNEKQKVLTKKHVARQERERRQVMIVRTVAIVMTVVVLVLLVYGYLDTNYLQKQKPAANVNGEKITIAELQERIQLQRLNLVNTIQQYQFFQEQFGMDYSQQIQQIQYYLQVPEAFGQVVLDQMVEEALIRQEAEKRGITVSEKELDEAIQNAYGFYADGTPTPTITPTPFEYPTLSASQLTYFPPTATPTIAPTSTAEPTSTPDLSATPTATFTAAPPTPTFVPEDVTPTATPYTLDGFNTQFSESLEQYKTYGISEKTLRNVYRNDLLRKKLQDVITADEPATEEQVWARHILVDTEPEAKALYDLLKNGSDFDSLAKEYSKDTGSGLQGGNLGWFGKGMMVSEFENAAFSLPIGEISEPIQTQFGYHIVQVLDRRELPISESQLQQKRDTVFAEWLATIKETAITAQFETWKEQIPPMPDFSNQAQ